MATFYLTYRPQTIDDLDLQSVRSQLTQVLQSKQIPHAFLFSGPRGLGKTSAARILAKAINCEHPNGIEPDNSCEACVSITKGNALDVIEIDGASNRGIDDIRALRESVASVPLRLKKKVYVIDEVHMLTREAFNALLKTLEEPPEHVVFILATTEPHKVPETIISRSFHIQFIRATTEELKRSLGRVIKGESLKVSDSVLDKIIAKAEGGFRDSAKMLEQLSFASKVITDDIFASVYPQASVQEFFEALSGHDSTTAFEWIAVQQEHGVDWEEVLRALLTKLRADLLAIYGIGTNNNQLFNEAELRQLITVCLQAAAQLKTTLVPTLPMELLVAEWCSNVIKVSEDQSHSTSEPTFLHPKETLQKNVKQETHQQKEKEDKKVTNIVVQTTPKTVASSKQPGDITVNLCFDTVKEKWEAFLTNVKPFNHSVEALLRSAHLHEVTGDTVTIKVYYEFHKGRLETDKALQVVEKVFEKMFSVKPKIHYVLGEKTAKKQLDEQKDADLVKIVEEVFTN